MWMACYIVTPVGMDKQCVERLFDDSQGCLYHDQTVHRRLR
jgi:hypothetical protein